MASDDLRELIMHQSIVSMATLSVFYSPAKSPAATAGGGGRYVVKSLLKAPAPRRLTIMWNNSWELFFVKKYERGS